MTKSECETRGIRDTLMGHSIIRALSLFRHSSFVIRHWSFSYHRVRFKNRQTRDVHVNREAAFTPDICLAASGVLSAREIVRFLQRERRDRGPRQFARS